MSNYSSQRVPATGKGKNNDRREDRSRSPRESTQDWLGQNLQASDDEVMPHNVERLIVVVPHCSSTETRKYTPLRHPHLCAHCAQDGTRISGKEYPDKELYSARGREAKKNYEAQLSQSATTPEALQRSRLPDAERRKERQNSPLSRGYHAGVPPPKDLTAAGAFKVPAVPKLTHATHSQSLRTTLEDRTEQSQGAAASTHRQVALDYEAMEEEAASYLENHQQYSEEDAYEMVRLRYSHISDTEPGSCIVEKFNNKTSKKNAPSPLPPTSPPPPTSVYMLRITVRE